MPIRALVVTACVALILSACGKKTEPAGENGQAPAKIEAAAPGGVAMSAPAPRIEGVRAYASPADFRAACQTAVSDIRARLAALESFAGAPTLGSVYKPYNEMVLELSNSWQETGLLQQVHPQKEMRDQGDECDLEFSKVATDISLSRPLYERVSKIDASAADEATKFSLFKTLRDFKRAGVDRDEATRQKLRSLIEEITKAGQVFDRVIREDVRDIELESADRLKGLPADYIDAHKPGSGGKIKITTDYPDYLPFMSYAEDDAARKALRVASRSRGYPQNDDNLKQLLKKRHELASLLGYSDYAAYDLEDKMAETPEKAKTFIEDINTIVKEPVRRDMGLLLERLKLIDPSASEVGVWQYVHLQELLRREIYAVDSKILRSYFQFANVKAGILKLSEDLFDVTIKDWSTPMWDTHVSAHDIYENGKLIGRFYLDLHPRDGKYKHAAHFPIATGIVGEQIPISALVMNLPGAEDPGALMEHEDVVTFLHEFGHLLHAQFGGHTQWVNNSGIATERDFVEAPSQLLENWAYDYGTLKRFAVNAAGETIPEDLVLKLDKARFFGLGIDTAVQVFYASLALEYYSRDPSSFQLLPEMMRIESTYSPFPYLDGTHFYANFGHLNGYGSTYYTYQWSLAIAEDLYTRFQAEGMSNPAVSLAYRKAILDRGGTASASQLIEGFLGRPWTAAAYSAFLKRED